MIERFENARELGDFNEMAAGLEQTDAAHEHAADGKFTMEQFDQRHASSDDIAPGFLADRFDAELPGGKLQNFIFDKTHRLVRTIDGIPALAKKPVAFQTAVGKTELRRQIPPTIPARRKSR